MNDHRYPTTAFNNDDITAKLDTPVYQEVISKRAGRGNTTLSYLRGDIIADQLNAIFGPLGWDLQASVPTIDNWEGEKEIGGYNQEKKLVNMHTVQVMTQMTLRIKARSNMDSDTIFRQTGIGYGEIETTKNRKEVVGMALKGAETDGFKRCASLLGRAMGMFLTGTGGQDEIDYAHNGKNADITKGKKMRSDRIGGNNNQSRIADQSADHSDNRPTTQRSLPAPKSEERQNNRQTNVVADRQDDRQDNRSSVQQAEHKTAIKTEQPRAEPEVKEARDNETKGTEKIQDVDFDLDRLPVTGEDQIKFSKTMLAKLDGFNQPSDKDKFVKKHYNTIKNLDSKYRRLLIERLGQQMIDFEAIGAK